MKICIIGALPASLLRFRGELIKSFVSDGHQVVAMSSGASVDDALSIKLLGARYVDYAVQRNGLNPFSDFYTLLNLVKLFAAEKPDLVLAYTIKPVIWGGIAAKIFSNIKFYGLITGLGFAFQKGGLRRNLLATLVVNLYRVSLSNASKIVFQNPDNLQAFVDLKIIHNEKAACVNGSGVDLDYYVTSQVMATGFTFLSIARLLGEKGLREYAAAAKILKKKYPDVVFQLLGPEDPSPDGISISEVNIWQKAGHIEYLGSTNDVRPYINNCSVFVLPSYHEGMPRTVLEAMAVGRPILTTNVPGCKETVVDGENGFLVPAENVEALVDCMERFILNPNLIKTMGRRSREIAEEKYDVHKVNQSILEIMGLS